MSFIRLPQDILLVASIILISLVFACQQQSHKTIEQKAPMQKIEQLYLSDIHQAIEHLDEMHKALRLIENDSAYDILHLQKARNHFLSLRKSFKRAELVMAFVDANNYKTLIQPNILKIEEEDATDIKIKSPFGLQVLEELLFLDSLNTSEEHIKNIEQSISLTSQRLKLVYRNTDLSSYKDYHFLWMFRDAIVRVALTGITGFDSPAGFALDDSQVVYEQLQKYIDLYRSNFENKVIIGDWKKQIESTQAVLESDFDSFDRFSFIKGHTHAQLTLWNQTVADWKVEFPLEMSIQNDANSLFSDSTFNLTFFYDIQLGFINQDKVALGKELFNDTKLSANGKMSCATCHQENLAFTDAQTKSFGQLRNSPTLTYSALQQGFFYENRAGSLEGQITSVINSDTEFHSDLELLVEAVENNLDYKNSFEEAYEKGVSEITIRNVIAHYIRSLSSFSSKFDKNISGRENTLTQSEINGFNLFMGKAACATCHFAPLFNGTVPPNYEESEMELIGVPSTNDTLNAKIDGDLGRYELFKTPERKHFFKTPTVRNIAKTAPYMHNGVYQTLEEVIDFYDRGGGVGMGVDLPYQTLPPDRLKLSEQEKQDLIAFLRTLTDQEYQ